MCSKDKRQVKGGHRSSLIGFMLNTFLLEVEDCSVFTLFNWEQSLSRCRASILPLSLIVSVVSCVRQCPSSTYGSYSSTREYPDDVIFFSRTHPLLQVWTLINKPSHCRLGHWWGSSLFQENVLPLGERPLLVRVGVHYKFSKLVVDRVEAVDGTYDVLFIGTGVWLFVQDAQTHFAVTKKR